MTKEYEIGEKVVVKTRYDYETPYVFETITRITKTFIETDKGKYSLRGQEWGTNSSWHYKLIDSGMSAEEAEVINAVWKEDHRRERIVTTLRQFTKNQWYALTTIELENILTLVSNAQPKEPSV